jgi:hypothetical protein
LFASVGSHLLLHVGIGGGAVFVDSHHLNNLRWSFSEYSWRGIYLFAYLNDEPPLLTLTFNAFCHHPLDCFHMRYAPSIQLRFSLTGFILILAATIFSALRWCLTQILLGGENTKKPESAKDQQHQQQQQQQQQHSDPIVALYSLSPIMAACLLFGSLTTELPNMMESPFFADLGTSFETIGLLGAGGMLALCMILAEFHLISNTNVVTLSG